MKRILVNESACIGCRLCEVYCRIAHSRSKEAVRAFNRESPPSMPRLRVNIKEPVSLSVSCRQCDEPSCVYSCITGALQKDPESGIVSVDATKCIGCWTCILACPLGAIRQDVESGRIVKCDLCPGEDGPVCVSNCPNEALVYAETGDTALVRQGVTG